MVDSSDPGAPVVGGTPSNERGESPVGEARRDRPGAAVVLVEAVLVATGCVFVTIGGIDVGTSESLTAKLFAGVLAVTGAGLLVTAAGFRRRRPWAGVVGTPQPSRGGRHP